MVLWLENLGLIGQEQKVPAKLKYVCWDADDQMF